LRLVRAISPKERNTRTHTRSRAKKRRKETRSLKKNAKKTKKAHKEKILFLKIPAAPKPPKKRDWKF